MCDAPLFDAMSLWKASALPGPQSMGTYSNLAGRLPRLPDQFQPQPMFEEPVKMSKEGDS